MSELAEKVVKTLRYHARQAEVAARGAWWDLKRPLAERPVFVVGCSRAGTTLVYKTLSESRVLGSLQRETHDFWAALHPLAERGWSSHAIPAGAASDADRHAVSRYFYAWTGRRTFVDKNNQNGLSAPYLNALFPDARFVYIKRSPGDNLNSLIEGWRRAEEFATWSDQLPAKVAVSDGRYTRWCFFLAEGWRDYLAAPVEDVCAFQYRAMNQAILDARSLVAPERWVEIRYEELIANPVGGFEAVFRACGVPFDAHLRTHCETVLARPYNAFSEIRADKWRDKPNREAVERVLPQVAEVARAMGYPS